VQNGKAEALATLLNDAFGKKSAQKSATAPTLAPALKPAEVKSSDAKDAAAPVPVAPSGATPTGAALSVPQDVRVIPDKDNNALLILASPADYEVIETALRKLDVVPRQVLIEVTIAEVTLKDELAFGLEWFFKHGSRISGKLDAGDSGIAQLAPGLAYTWTSKTGDITGILNMLATDSKLKIISSPHITVADNQKATIQVGDQVPTITQTQTATATTSGVISSVQYLDTGVMLNVTPRVNASGLVNLEINQEISNASKTTSSSIDSPTIQKRSAKSMVTVQSGETLVMAGLIKEEKSQSSDGLPWLSEIPVLGGLFGAQSRTDNRTELIILITPRVMQTVKQASEVTAEYRRRMSGLEDMLKTLDPERSEGAPQKTGPVDSRDNHTSWQVLPASVGQELPAVTLGRDSKANMSSTANVKK
jgi:general secretion pathway protein D